MPLHELDAVFFKHRTPVGDHLIPYHKRTLTIIVEAHAIERESREADLIFVLLSEEGSIGRYPKPIPLLTSRQSNPRSNQLVVCCVELTIAASQSVHLRYGSGNDGAGGCGLSLELPDQLAATSVITIPDRGPIPLIESLALRLIAGIEHIREATGLCAMRTASFRARDVVLAKWTLVRHGHGLSSYP